MDDIINFLENPRKGLFNVNKLYPKLLDEGYNINRKELLKIINSLLSYQLTQAQTKPKYNQIYAPYVGFNYQIDILIYDRYEYHKYKYILCCIDVYSRYVSCRAMTNRRDETILKNIKDIFNEMGKPENINCDLEFNNKLIKKYAEDNNIKFYFSEANDVVKNGIVERFNRTLANLLQKYRIASGKYDWYNYLVDIVYNYNHTYHSTIKNQPYEIFEGMETNNQIFKPKLKHTFKVGDNVRITKKKSIFEKGDTIIYSKEIYKIIMIDKNKIYLNDIDRSFKPYQLKQSNEVYIKDFNYEPPINERKKEKQMKKDDINDKNITQNKRVRKSTKKDDYIY